MSTTHLESGNVPLVIYHAGCVDGQGSATAFYARCPDSEFYPGVYSEEPPDVAGRDVYLVDFSYPIDVLKEMLAVARHVTIIDHHDTMIQALEDFEHIRLTKFLSNDNSGAVLTWLYLHPGVPVPQLLYHIEDRDLWRFASEFTRPICAYLYSLDFVVAEWALMLEASFFNRNMGVMIAAGEALMRSDAKRVQSLKRNAYLTIIAGHQVYEVNANHFHASDLGHELAKGMPFAATYFDTPEHRVYSLRSDKQGLHVGEIAAQFGGGGHEHAAGFKLPSSKVDSDAR